MYYELSCFPVERENFGFISSVTVWLKCSIKLYSAYTPQAKSEPIARPLPLPLYTSHSSLSPTSPALYRSGSKI